MKKALFVTVFLALFCAWFSVDSACAEKVIDKAAQPAPTAEAQKAATDRLDEAAGPRKGSIYDAMEWLIKNKHYEGNAISRDDFRANSGVNPETDEPYSVRTIGREIDSGVIAGLIDLDEQGNIFIPRAMNMDVLNSIHEQSQAVIATTEPGTGEALGLKRYNLADLPDDQKDEIKRIVNETVLSGNQSVKTVAFPFDFARDNETAFLAIVGSLRPDQKAVIVADSAARAADLSPEVQARIASKEIAFEVVQPGTPAAEQFAEAFQDQAFTGLSGDLDELRTAIEKGEVLK